MGLDCYHPGGVLFEGLYWLRDPANGTDLWHVASQNTKPRVAEITASTTRRVLPATPSMSCHGSSTTRPPPPPALLPFPRGACPAPGSSSPYCLSRVLSIRQPAPQLQARYFTHTKKQWCMETGGRSKAGRGRRHRKAKSKTEGGWGGDMHQHEKTKRDMRHITCQYEQVFRTHAMRGVDCGMVWRSIERVLFFVEGHKHIEDMLLWHVYSRHWLRHLSEVSRNSAQRRSSQIWTGFEHSIAPRQAVGTDRYIKRELALNAISPRNHPLKHHHHIGQGASSFGSSPWEGCAILLAALRCRNQSIRLHVVTIFSGIHLPLATDLKTLACFLVTSINTRDPSGACTPP